MRRQGHKCYKVGPGISLLIGVTSVELNLWTRKTMKGKQTGRIQIKRTKGVKIHESVQRKERKGGGGIRGRSKTGILTQGWRSKSRIT